MALLGGSLLGADSEPKAAEVGWGGIMTPRLY